MKRRLHPGASGRGRQRSAPRGRPVAGLKANFMMPNVVDANMKKWTEILNDLFQQTSPSSRAEARRGPPPKAAGWGDQPRCWARPYPPTPRPSPPFSNT